MKKQRKIAASYSGGKDGALALYRAIKKEYDPVGLLTTYNKEQGRSWFHGVPLHQLESVSEAVKIPLKLVPTGPADDYAKDFVRALEELKAQGVQACVFGDIDIQDHYDWCDGCCKQAGITSIFPLWGESRKKLVYEMIDSGFRSVITIVDTMRMSEKFLGETLTRQLAEEIEQSGADICGENGEYHSFVYDGPIFSEPVPVSFGEKIYRGNHAILPMR